MLARDEIKNIAALARVGLEEGDVEKYQKDLSAVLDYFKELEKLDTSEIAPINHITGMHNVLREDRDVDFGKLGKDAILQNAPEVKDRSIKVKSVL